MLHLRFRLCLLCLLSTGLILLVSGCNSPDDYSTLHARSAAELTATSIAGPPPAPPTGGVPTALPTSAPPPPAPATTMALASTHTPKPTVAPYLTPDSSFYATLNFSPTLTIDQFKSFVVQTRMMPLNTVAHVKAPGHEYFVNMHGVWAKDVNGWPSVGTPVPGSEGLDDQDLWVTIQKQQGTELAVVSTTALMDEAILSRAQLDPRVTLVERTEVVTAGESVVARWKQAYESLHTIKGTHTFMQVLADGRREPRPTPDGTGGSLDRFPISNEELYSIDHTRQEPWAAKYFITSHTLLGDQVTSFDGQQSYRYSTWLNELHSPLPPGAAGPLTGPTT